MQRRARHQFQKSSSTPAQGQQAQHPLHDPSYRQASVQWHDPSHALPTGHPVGRPLGQPHPRTSGYSQLCSQASTSSSRGAQTTASASYQYQLGSGYIAGGDSSLAGSELGSCELPAMLADKLVLSSSELVGVAAQASGQPPPTQPVVPQATTLQGYHQRLSASRRVLPQIPCQMQQPLHQQHPQQPISSSQHHHQPQTQPLTLPSDVIQQQSLTGRLPLDRHGQQLHHHGHQIMSTCANKPSPSRSHQHRRRSSLELERERQLTLGYTPDEFDYELELDHPLASQSRLGTRPPTGTTSAAQFEQLPPPPIISVSPNEFDASEPLRYSDSGYMDMSSGIRHAHHSMGGHFRSTSRLPTASAAAQQQNLYSTALGPSHHQQPRYYTDQPITVLESHQPQRSSHQPLQLADPLMLSSSSLAFDQRFQYDPRYAQHQNIQQHHQQQQQQHQLQLQAFLHQQQHLQQQQQQQQHHQQSHRNMAMGSDSELNTRGLSSRKLYYVHVPQSKRSSRHTHSSGSTHHHTHPAQQLQVNPKQHQQPGQGHAQAAVPDPAVMLARHRSTSQVSTDYQIHPSHAESPVMSRVVQPYEGSVIEPEAIAASRGHHQRTISHLDELATGSYATTTATTTPRRRPPPPPPPTHLIPTARQPHHRGVTFEGRASAPLEDEDDDDLDEGRGGVSEMAYPDSEPETEPSKGASRKSRSRHRIIDNADAFQVSDDGHHTNSMDSFTASSSRPGARGGAFDQHQQHDSSDSKSGARSSKHHLADTSKIDLGRKRVDSRASRLSGAATPPVASAGSQLELSVLAAGGHQPMRPAKLQEGASLSDAGGMSLHSDKEHSSPAGHGGSSSGATGKSRERRARVRDANQSSNERSTTGDGGGSSQSLKSASGNAGSVPSGLGKKSNSTTQLSLSGTKKRLGFRKKQVTMFSVHRSEEVVPQTARHLVKQTTSVSSDGEGSISNESASFRLNPSPRFDLNDPRASFVEGLGAGQIISRQALASPDLGDIQLSLCDRKGCLEVEVIRARRLQSKAGAKTLPSPYVKIYLMRNRKCLAKAKTTAARRTLDPLYQQQLIFREDYRKCVLQLIVWGDYGRMNHKVLMGIVQIQLDDLNLSTIVISWYKLFNPSAMTMPSKSLRHSMLSSFDSKNQMGSIQDSVQLYNENLYT